MNHPVKEISAHELSEQRQKKWLDDASKGRDWGGIELNFDPQEVREKMKQSRAAHTQEVRIQIP